MENFTDKENNTELVLREKRLQMSNQYAEVVVEYGADHPYSKALQSRFKTFDAFVFEFFGLNWDSNKIEYVKPVIRDTGEEKEEK
jgi:uncharacterized protein involved in exopolysaccharide biosynthesis